ncbi:hypothetical protein GC173_13375 [bacterium]|nr:hypothetical protein [bacterium]
MTVKQSKPAKTPRKTGSAKPTALKSGGASARPMTRTTKTEDPAAAALLQHLTTHFPAETVAVKRTGVRNRLNVLVVSSRFNGMTTAKKEKVIWELIQSAPISEVEKAGVGFALALGIDDFI